MIFRGDTPLNRHHVGRMQTHVPRYYLMGFLFCHSGGDAPRDIATVRHRADACLVCCAESGMRTCCLGDGSGRVAGSVEKCGLGFGAENASVKYIR